MSQKGRFSFLQDQTNQENLYVLYIISDIISQVNNF